MSVQLAHWIHRKEGQCVDSEVSCSTGIMVGCLASLMLLDESFHIPTNMLGREGRYVLTGENYRVQCSHKELQSSNNTQTVYFVIMMMAEGSMLYVCGALHLYVLCTKQARTWLGMPRGLERSVFLQILYFPVMAAYKTLGWYGEGRMTSITIYILPKCKTS